MKNLLVTITGPSGSGKSTIVKNLFTRYPDKFGEAVSTTTRKPRVGEIEGVAYFFVDPTEFERRWLDLRFLERVKYNGNLYGIETSAVKCVSDTGKTTLLIVEPHGARQIRERYVGPLVQVFIKPPSIEYLRTWMAGRGDRPEEIERRLALDAKVFDEHGFPWSKVITNHTVDQVCGEILTLIGMEAPQPPDDRSLPHAPTSNPPSDPCPGSLPGL